MDDKTAIVTGAARGIGLATTRLFLQEGCRVAMFDRDAEALETAAAGLDGALPVLCDVSVPTQVDTMIGTVLTAFGHLDALVNNAGVADFGPMGDTAFDQWHTVMATNLDGVFLCSQAAAPALKEKGGAIVNIASISGLRASTLRVAYGTSEAAVMHLTQQRTPNSASSVCAPIASRPARSTPSWRSPSTRRRSAPPITTPSRSTATVRRPRSPRSSSFCAPTRRAM